MASNSESRQGRIPLALQMIFLHSNRGFTVDQPPPARSADRVFVRGLFHKKHAVNTAKPRDNLTAGSSTPDNDCFKIRPIDTNQSQLLMDENNTTVNADESDDESEVGRDRVERQHDDGDECADEDDDSDVLFDEYEAEMEELLKLMDRRWTSSRTLVKP